MFTGKFTIFFLFQSATTGVKDGGQGHNGGVWEWTSTKLASYEGYVASTLYPGYASMSHFFLPFFSLRMF